MRFTADYFKTIYSDPQNSWGISPAVYHYFALTVIEVCKAGDIEPVSWEPLDNRAGGICILYGRKYVFHIRIECHFPVPVVCLDIGMLDDPGELKNVGGGDAEDLSNWRLIVAMLLKAEGFTEVSLPELDACL